MHYQRWRKHGDPFIGGRCNTPEVFWSRVDRSGGPDACWPWTGRRKPPTGGMPEGHGIYDHDGTWDYAHRYAFELAKGPLENWALHTCDVAPCCNPAHLYDGTVLDNARDRERRHRRIPARGEQQGAAKLTWDAVRIIRATPKEYGYRRALARRFGVSKGAIDQVLLGATWKEEYGPDRTNARSPLLGGEQPETHPSDRSSQ